MRRLISHCFSLAAVLILATLAACGSSEETTSSTQTIPINVPSFIRDRDTNRIAERNQGSLVVNGQKDLIGINKRWKIEDAGNGLVRFRNMGDLRCMAAQNFATFAFVKTDSCASNMALWKIDSTPDGVQIRFAQNAAATDYCLAVSGENPVLGNNFIIYPCQPNHYIFFFDIL